MKDRKPLAALIRVLLCLQLVATVTACSRPPEAVDKLQATGFTQTVDSEVAAIKPEKPLRIKLKRLADGKHSWEITGGSTQRIIAADRELRESLDRK